MKKILPFFLVIISCGWFNPDKDFPTKESVPPPSIDVEVEGSPGLVYYAPDLNSLDIESAEKCSVEEIEEIVGPYKVETNLVSFVYGTIDFNESIPVRRPELHGTSYVHTKKARLEVAAGEDLDFFSWAKIYTEDQLVAWGGPQEEDVYATELNIDGSVELKQYWRDEHININGEIRGRIPRSDTWVQGRLTFLRFYDCE